MDAVTADRPLARWRFDGVLRTYQQEVLDQIPVGSDGTAMHIVAPPGSGKTLLGLLLAAREGGRALVLTPTVTIRQQWVSTARRLASDGTDVSDDPADLAPLTALTYQLLSVTGDGSPFDDLARAQWIEELVAAGRGEAEAATWLAELAVDNPARYGTGIRRRGKSFRRRFVQARPDELARVLHPNALALIDRLVSAGVTTIVLDECHHLLDHWAIVVSYLTARIRESGGKPLLIGLTATLPSPDDGREFENYSQLLGEVDYEVPTPAVVKEGHLAPYRDHIWFTEPVPQEAQFIRRAERQLHELMLHVLSSPDGIRYLEDQLQPPAGPDSAQEAVADADEQSRLGIDRALSADFPLARACGSVLAAVAPRHPLCALLDPDAFGRASTDDLLTVLARFALTRLLPDPDAQEQWRYVKGGLADFGLHLTDRGIRRGRSPLESTLATSIAKDHAAVDILHHELQGADAARIRAVVVADVVEAGNHRGLVGDTAPGALRIFDLIANDPVTAALSPVLLTGQHLRATAGDAAAIADALTVSFGVPVEIDDGVGAVRELRAPGIGGGRLVAAVSELMAEGTVRIIVGTRGLLGEGWDCPAANTLIDLTTVATSAGSQQLRGRTLRLDPGWAEKVAHNWSVACLIPPHVDLDDTAEADRLRRRHGHLWGLSADDRSSVVAGLPAALDRAALDVLARVLAKDTAVSIDDLRAAALASVRARAQTRADWQIGERGERHEREVVSARTIGSTALVGRSAVISRGIGSTFTAFGIAGGAAVAALSGIFDIGLPPQVGVGIAIVIGAGTAAVRWARPAARALRRRREPGTAYLAAARVVSQALAEAGRIRPLPESAITVSAEPAEGGTHLFRVGVRGPAQDRRLVADAVGELLGAVQTPRFLLAAGTGRRAVLLPVPQAIGRRRADAERFVELWRESVGQGELIELQGGEGLRLLRAARSRPALLDRSSPRTTVWG